VVNKPAQGQGENTLTVAFPGETVQFSHGIQTLAIALALELGIVLSQVVTSEMSVFAHLPGQQAPAEAAVGDGGNPVFRQ